MINDNKKTRNIKLIIAYDGTAYHGFQRQSNALAVQQILEERLTKLFGHTLKINGAARTDTGVHAYGQVVNFYTTGTIPVDKIPLAARGILPDDIVIRSAEDVNGDFHARISAVGKIYIYRIHQDRIADPFLLNYAWQVKNTLDAAAMHDAAQRVVGTHDFSAFRAAGSAPVNPVRTIFEASCRQEEQMITLTFWGNGFLYHMVRNLVGTLVNVGLGRISKDDFIKIMESRNRKLAGITAPAQGLYLQEVKY